MKKILLLNYEFPPLGGGAANATYYLLKEFAKNDSVKIVLVTSSVSEYKHEQFSDNIDIYYLDIAKNGNLHYQSNKDLLLYSWKAFWFCKKLKRKENFDLIHAFFGIPCGFVAMLLKTPYIVSLRGSDVPFYNERFEKIDKLLFKRLSKRIWGKARVVITNSEGLKGLALQSAPKQKIEVIYNGVDTDFFKPVDKKEDVFTIVSTSRLIARKGINYLIDAFIDLSKKISNVKLIIVGDGDLRVDLENKVKESGISDKIEFWGKVEKKDIIKAYQRSDVFILPSLNEGMSNSLLEAMSCGLVIVATDVGGTKELVDRNNGIIIKKESSADILSALNQIYNDKAMLEEMKKNSRKKAELMCWEEVADKYVRLY